jgi:hypothetical protein
MPWCAMSEPTWRDKLRAIRHQEKDNGEWEEPGSDDLMAFEVLARVKAEGELAEAHRERKIQRRSE